MNFGPRPRGHARDLGVSTTWFSVSAARLRWALHKPCLAWANSIALRSGLTGYDLRTAPTRCGVDVLLLVAHDGSESVHQCLNSGAAAFPWREGTNPDAKKSDHQSFIVRAYPGFVAGSALGHPLIGPQDWGGCRRRPDDYSGGALVLDATTRQPAVGSFRWILSAVRIIWDLTAAGATWFPLTVVLGFSSTLPAIAASNR